MIEPSKNGWFLHVFAEYECEYDWKFSGLPAKVASFMWLEQAFPATGWLQEGHPKMLEFSNKAT